MYMYETLRNKRHYTLSMTAEEPFSWQTTRCLRRSTEHKRVLSFLCCRDFSYLALFSHVVHIPSFFSS